MNRKVRGEETHQSACGSAGSRLFASCAGGRRASAAARAATRAVRGPAHAELRETLLGLLRSALRAFDLRVRAEDQPLEAFLAGTTLIFVDRHSNARCNHR